MSTNTSRPWILGLASSHNGAVCLLHGDEIVVAIQEERLLRMKRAYHPAARKSLAIQYCLDYAGISAADLSAIAVSVSSDNTVPSEDVRLNPALQPARHGVPTMVVGHHLAHAYATFATSGFEEAAVLIVDGSGSPWDNLSEEERRVVRSGHAELRAEPDHGPVMEIISMYSAQGATISPLAKQVGARDLRPKSGMRRFWSLGYMYEAIADQIFGSGLDSAGKMMGLAPYGSSVLPVSDFYTVTDNELVFLDTIPDRYLHHAKWPSHLEEYQNLAASTQVALEEAMLLLAARCRQLTGGARRLCLAGGVALNSVANERLVREAAFDDVFIMPAAEDSGTAIGAAFYALWQLTPRRSYRRLPHDAVGRTYSPAEVAAPVERCPSIRVLGRPGEDTLERAVELLAAGKILGWFWGRSELGPRALGQRSIVCDPRHPDMKGLLNERVKFRESFRPFAPVVPVDQLPAYFETAGPHESPFMLRVMSFKPDARARMPGVVHVDGTGRVQTVTPDANGAFYELVARFAARTGSPVLLNTSFNVAGEPIVETPEDALACLLSTGLDACMLQGTLVEKAPHYTSVLDLVYSLAVERVTMDSYLGRSRRRPLEPGPDLRLRYVHAAHLDRAADVENNVAGYDEDLLRVVTRTAWGPVICVMNAELRHVLARVDGTRTGWQLLEALREELQPSLTDEALIRMLVALKRFSIVNWRDREPGPRASMTGHRETVTADAEVAG